MLLPLLRNTATGTEIRYTLVTKEWRTLGCDGGTRSTKPFLSNVFPQNGAE